MPDDKKLTPPDERNLDTVDRIMRKIWAEEMPKDIGKVPQFYPEPQKEKQGGN